MLNDLDERIVHALAEDARRSYADIGQMVGLSAPAVKRRVDRLRATGAITGFTVRVDPAALGWETEGFIEIYCRRNTSPETIQRGLERYQEVVAASTVTGDADAIAQVFASDMRHFERVLERIAGEPFVERTKSVLVLSPLLRRFSSGAPRVGRGGESGPQPGAPGRHRVRVRPSRGAGNCASSPDHPHPADDEAPRVLFRTLPSPPLGPRNNRRPAPIPRNKPRTGAQRLLLVRPSAPTVPSF